MNSILNSMAGLAGYFQWRDAVDILIVAALIYVVIAFVRQSRTYFVFYALAFLLAVNYAARALNLSLTRQIFQLVLTFMLLFFVVVFQKEIRRFFEWFSAYGRRLVRERQLAISSGSARTIAETVFEMARKKIGAIIVFPGDFQLDQLLEGGFSLDGRISRPLLLSIFDTSSPGHDGAVIIDNNRVRRFGVHLPLAERFDKFASVGTRHRATAGITQRSDAVAVVVSEERGEVSWSEGGKLEKIGSAEELERLVGGFFKEDIEAAAGSQPWHRHLASNWPAKAVSVALAVLLWFVFVFQIGVTSQDFRVPVEFRYLPKSMTLDQVSPAAVDVTLSGNYRDLHALRDKDLKVFVDAPQLGSGWQKVTLTEANIQYPPYLTLVTTVPKTVTFKAVQSAQP